MTGLMLHRGPDSAGFHFSAEASLGMRRLSIIDLSSGSQPIYNEEKTACVVFNGEIYNFQRLRSGLEARGHRFSTNTDTEVLIHLYEEEGEDCCRFLEGMFAFAVCDFRKQSLFIARDQLGVKPLYYSVCGGKLVFASEMKPLLAADFVKRELDFEALDSYLRYLCVPEPLAIFKDVKKLPSGHFMVFDLKKRELSIRRYWRPDFSKKTAIPEAELPGMVSGLLSETVEKQLVSDVPLGVFLSGGLDSSAITAFAAKKSARPLKTFSIGFEGEGEDSYNELSAAKRVASLFGTDHREILVKPDAAETVLRLAWHFDEPHADSSAIVTYLISKHAREQITVALTGIGGGELFGGYPRYAGMKAYRYYSSLPAGLRRAAAKFSSGFEESGKSRDWANWAKRFFAGGVLSPFDCYDAWTSFLDAKTRAALYSPELLEKTSGFFTDGARRAIFDGFSGDISDKTALLDLKTYLNNDLLMMADKMSMANSLELRVPFCDVKLAEFMLSLPAKSRFGGFGLKPLLKKSLDGILPPEILGKRKQGFMVPLPLWLKGGLREMTRDFLSEASIKKRGYFNAAAVDEILRLHYEGKKNSADLIWSLIMLEAWHRTYVDSDFRAKAWKPGLSGFELKPSAQKAGQPAAASAVRLNNPGKILAVLSAGIGDFIIAVPALKALRRKFPSAKITLVVSSRVLGYAGGCPDVDEIIVFDNFRLHSPSAWRTKGVAELRTLARLRREKYGLAINFYDICSAKGSAKMLLLFKFINAAVSAGRNTDGRGFFFDVALEEKTGEGICQGERYARLAGLLGCSVRPEDKSALWISAEAESRAEGFLKNHGVRADNFILINPGSARASRLWRPERFAETADFLAKKYGFSVVISGGPGEERLAEEVAASMSEKPAVMAGKLQFEAALSLVRRAKLLITTHSSLMHAAAAFDTPFVVICGISDIGRDGPYHFDPGRYAVLKGRQDAPSDENAVSPAMLSVSAESVSLAASELLDRVYGKT